MNALTHRRWLHLAVAGVFLTAAAGAASSPEPTAQPATVKLTGVTAVLGHKQALMLVQEPAGAGQPPAPERSCILSEGQAQGPIEVLEIDVKAGRVKIINSGVPMELSLIRDGLELPVAPAPAPPATASASKPAPAAAAPKPVPAALAPTNAAVTTPADTFLADLAEVEPAPIAPRESVVIGRSARRQNPPRFSSGLIPLANDPTAPTLWPGLRRINPTLPTTPVAAPSQPIQLTAPSAGPVQSSTPVNAQPTGAQATQQQPTAGSEAQSAAGSTFYEIRAVEAPGRRP